MSTLSGISSGKRLVSLDFFRGATVAAMILVNNPGSWSHIYGPLKHAAWHGWTPTDLIFPFFLFIVGVSIVLAFTKARAKGADDKDLLNKTLIRAAKIFGLGLALSAFPYLTFIPDFGLHQNLIDIRIPGVLQRIAICYAIGAVLFLYTKPKTQMVTLGSLLVGYWLLMTFIPVPGHGAGAIDTSDGNLAAYIDQIILGSHMWKANWDPEGFLSTLPAIGSTLIGIWTGRMLMSKQDSESSRTLQFFVWGFILIILGYAWSWIFPINKNIWTSSYTLFTGGQAMCIFGLSYWFIDVKEKQKFTDWGVAFGLNAITVFFMSGIIGRLLYIITFNYRGETFTVKSWIYEIVLNSIASPINASLIYAIIWIILFYFLATWMKRKDIIIKV
ncbi:acyltransferase family protein [Gracilimonas tropica]|uniref:acyltransferase family protein n=1 Tax=Gracilimonas tropica TaxID=454600 RepID=UPI0003A44D6A|nr:heparan-alpha-glucosaminide N-acetyltransferase domain-containing protein [Gracilimonas tropica]